MSRRNYPSDTQDFEVDPNPTKRAKLSGKNPQRLSLPSSSVLDLTGLDSPSPSSHRGLKSKEISASVKWEGAEIINDIQEAGFVVKFEYGSLFPVRPANEN